MPFAVRRFVQAAVVVLLGCAVAVLVACGDSNGLLPGDEASSLRDAVAGVESACSAGELDRAQASAAQFQRDVAQLSPADVDRRLIRNLREGASTLQQLVDERCAEVVETVPTETLPVEPAPVETTPTVPTTPTTPVDPTTTTPPDDGTTTTPPDDGTVTPPDDGTTPPDDGTTPPDDGGVTPPDTGGSSQPDVNRGTPGGALAPGQGGSG